MIILTLHSLFFPAAGGADALDDVLRLNSFPAFGQGDSGDADVGEAVGAVAAGAGEVDVPCALACVVVVADTVFLYAAAIVDVVQQVGYSAI